MLPETISSEPDSTSRIVTETKLLGCLISSDMIWWANTNLITRKAYQRLGIIRKLYEFNVALNDLVLIYTLYVRSILEFNSCVWHFSITKAEEGDIERVQKIACKIMLKEEYSSYENALAELQLENLKERRLMLSKRFAKKCLKFDKSKSMFPLNEPSQHDTRTCDPYKVNFASTSRLRDSAIPQMQRLLNLE